MKESFIISFITFDVIFVILVILLVVKYRRKQATPLKEIFENLANKRNGKVITTYMGLAMHLDFPFEDIGVTLRFSPGGKNSPPFTNIETKLFSQSKLHINVYPENFLTKFGKKLGLKDYQVNNPEFDDAFVVSGNDEFLVPSIMDFEVQNALLQIKDKSPQFSFVRNQFRFMAPGVPKQEQEYDMLIESALTILKKLKGAV